MIINFICHMTCLVWQKVLTTTIVLYRLKSKLLNQLLIIRK